MMFLIANGEIADVREISLNHLLTESSFRLAQKVWYGYGGIPLLNENVELIKKQAEVLRICSPKILDDQRELFRITKRMLNKNRFYRSGYLHFQLFWIAGEVHSLITCNAFREFNFPYSENGLLVTFSNQKKQSENRLNRFPFFNEMIWQAGLGEIHGSSWQQLILMNEHGMLCEGIQANIFLIHGKKLITPALSTGCYEDVLRPYILSAAEKAGLKVVEMSRTDRSDIFEMDEIFMASETEGIQWILGVENKRFLHHLSKIIHEKVSNILQEKVAG